MDTEGLRATEAECAEGRTAPRVSLDDINAAIETEFFFTGRDAIQTLFLPDFNSPTTVLEEDRRDNSGPLGLLTVCIIVLTNGFTIIGKSAPASAANFDPALGRKLAHEDAIRQIWPLMGFALRDRLAAS